MPNIDPTTLDLLRLTLTPGLGPVLIARLIETCGSAEAALCAPASQLRHVKAIGADKARSIRDGLDASEALALEELALAASLGVVLIGILEPAYPPLLQQIPDPPPSSISAASSDPRTSTATPSASWVRVPPPRTGSSRPSASPGTSRRPGSP